MLIRSKREVCVCIYLVLWFRRKLITLLSWSVCFCGALLFNIQIWQGAEFKYCVLIVCEYLFNIKKSGHIFNQ